MKIPPQFNHISRIDEHHSVEIHGKGFSNSQKTEVAAITSTHL